MIKNKRILTEIVVRNLKKKRVGEPTMKRTENVVSARHEIRKQLKIENAVFWELNQEQDLLLNTHEQEDVLVVRPTGCGKSMMFFIPASLKMKMVCVVVLPIVELEHDLFRRCSQMVIQFISFGCRR